MIAPELREVLEAGASSRLRSLSRSSAEFEDGTRAFFKTHPGLPAEAFVREAEGLAWLAETKTVNVPRVLAVGSVERGAFLLIERVITGGRGARDTEARFGRELAALHRSGAPSFGLWTSNYLATLPQDNREAPDFATFYRERRLEPLVARAERAGVMPSTVRARFDRLYERLPEHLGPPEPPARLHGDLWAGNRLVDQAGVSWVIDPAIYGGHREIDLAMMRLFGGFSGEVFAAYDEAFPLAEGHEDRVELFQLYPLLAHLVMFGTGYLGQVESALVPYLCAGLNRQGDERFLAAKTPRTPRPAERDFIIPLCRSWRPWRLGG